MIGDARSIMWEAPQHRHIEKTGDWYWVVGIIAISASVVSIMFDNVLFGVVILLGATTMILFSHRHPRTLTYEVSVRGVRIEDTLYPYTSLDSFAIDEESPDGPQLIVKSAHLFMPLLILPLPQDYIDDIEDLMSAKLVEAPLVEPLSHRLLEFFGF
jgi:hypothetical protein